MAKLLRYRDYNPIWKMEFEKLKEFYDSFLLNLIVDIHHIGSTSVVGLGAKPIIDIDIEYQDNFDLIRNALEQHGYEYEGDKGITGRYAFKTDSKKYYEHHMYVVHSDSLELQRHLLLKETLTRSKYYRDKYQELKKNLIKANNIDRNLYVDNKTDLIEEILRKSDSMKSIVFAGGCFWGVEAYFKMIDGVLETEVGYIAGNGETTYEEVCAGAGHAEAVYIHFDEEKVSIKKLMDHLFNIIDPTSINKQGNDIGIQYRSGIYNYTPEQLPFITNYISIRQKEYKRPIAIELQTNLQFFKAEEYHQDYLTKNKNGYCHVNLNSHGNVE